LVVGQHFPDASIDVGHGICDLSSFSLLADHIHRYGQFVYTFVMSATWPWKNSLMNWSDALGIMFINLIVISSAAYMKNMVSYNDETDSYQVFHLFLFIGLLISYVNCLACIVKYAYTNGRKANFVQLVSGKYTVKEVAAMFHSMSSECSEVGESHILEVFNLLNEYHVSECCASRLKGLPRRRRSRCHLDLDHLNRHCNCDSGLLDGIHECRKTAMPLCQLGQSAWMASSSS